MKDQNIWSLNKFAVKLLKFCLRFYNGVMLPKDADGIANSEGPDQIATLGVV